MIPALVDVQVKGDWEVETGGRCFNGDGFFLSHFHKALSVQTVLFTLEFGWNP